MDKLIRHPALEIRPSPIHGWGVFTTQDMTPGTVVEECPFISIPHASQEHVHSALTPFVFAWPLHHPTATAVPMGYAMLYNHSREYNVRWRSHQQRMLMVFHTTCAVKAGDELLHNYGHGYWSHRVAELRASYQAQSYKLGQERSRLLRASSQAYMTDLRKRRGYQLLRRWAATVEELRVALEDAEREEQAYSQRRHEH